MTTKSHQHRGIFFLLAAATLWSGIGPLSKFLFQMGMPPIETAFWRGLIAALCFLAHLAVTRKASVKPIMLSRHFLMALIFGCICVATLEGAFVKAVETGGAALASVLLYTAPVWVFIFGITVLRESVTRRQIISLILSLAGVFLISMWGRDFTISSEALFFGLLSGIGYASFYIYGQIAFRYVTPIFSFGVAFLAASITLFAIMTSGGGLQRFTITSLERPFHVYLALACLGFGMTYLPYLLYGYGLQNVESKRASIITMFEPVFSVVLAYFIWDESFTIAGYLGIFMVIVALYMSSSNSSSQ